MEALRRALAAALCVLLSFCLCCCASPQTPSGSGEQGLSGVDWNSLPDSPKQGEALRLAKDGKFTVTGIKLHGDLQAYTPAEEGSFYNSPFSLSGILTDFMPGEQMEILCETDYGGPWSDICVLCCPHRPLSGYGSVSFASLKAQAEKDGFTFSPEGIGTDEWNYNSLGSVKIPAGIKSGDYDLFFFCNKTPCYVALIHVSDGKA